jgi:hypothetical protein
MRSRRWLRAARLSVAAIVVSLGLASVACTSPTLPLPPPAQPTVSVGSEPNTFRLKSEKGALPNALVIVVNRNESLSRGERVDGTIADPQGSWELVIAGHVGDLVDISQQDGATQSPATTVTLK